MASSKQWFRQASLQTKGCWLFKQKQILCHNRSRTDNLFQWHIKHPLFFCLFPHLSSHLPIHITASRANGSETTAEGQSCWTVRDEDRLGASITVSHQFHFTPSLKADHVGWQLQTQDHHSSDWLEDHRTRESIVCTSTCVCPLQNAVIVVTPWTSTVTITRHQ